MDVTVVGLIGLALTFVTCVGGLIVRDRALLALITNGDKAVHDALEKRVDNAVIEAKREDAALHERINRVRDEFVRRDDLDQHLGRIEKNLNQMYIEQRETNQRIDGFMSAMVGNNDRVKTK